jgi:hypothetical protein
VFLAVLTHAHRGIRSIATHHEDSGTAAALDQRLRCFTLHGLERAGNAPLPVQGPQGDAEHRHVHLCSLLRAQANRQHLDKAHASCAMNGFADSGAGDKWRHAVIHQTGHHVTRGVR